MTVDDMFDQFPKTRPELPEEIAKIYTIHYRENRQGKTRASFWAQRMESWLHKKVANDIVKDHGKKTTLEIGAGTLNQMKYEPQVGPYDIVEPFKELYSGSPFLKRVRTIYSDIAEVPQLNKYDRIISAATFEHICNLPAVVARCGLLLEPNGQLRVSIPSEGTFLWKLGWRLTTGLEFRLRYGFDYGLIIKHEHVNVAAEIEDLLRYFFSDIKYSFLGLAKSFSLYQFYECKNPKMERCFQFAKR